MIQNCRGSSCSWTLRPEVLLLLRQLCFLFPVWEKEQERHPEDPVTSARNARCNRRTSLLRVKFISCFPVFLRTFRFSFQRVSHCLDLDRIFSYLCILSEQIQNRTCLLSLPSLHWGKARAPHPVWITREGWLGARVSQHCLPIDCWLHLWTQLFYRTHPRPQ